MKSKIIVSLALLLASLSLSQAQTAQPIAVWTFDGVSQNIKTNPAPVVNHSFGGVSADCIGMDLFGGGTTNAPDVTNGTNTDSSGVGSPGTGGDGITNLTQVWRIRGLPGNGWTSTAGIGTQGAEFNADTTGYTNIQVSFDWYLSPQGEANLQFQYTDDGSTWINLALNIPFAQSNLYLLSSNNATLTAPNSVQGYFVQSVAYPGGQQWYTNLSAVITDPLAANNPHFAIRLVNASTGSDCVNGEGAALDNSSGNWRFDNVNISGVALAKYIAQWTFENITVAPYVPNPAPSVNNTIGGVSVAAIGMTTYASTVIGTNDPDVLLGVKKDSDGFGSPGSSAGGDGITNTTQEWRVRAQNAAGTANGWNSAAPPGTQGAQFNVDTTSYTNIQVTFDWYLTKQGEANLQFQYTDNGSTWINYPLNIPLAQSNLYILNSNNATLTAPNSVQGYFVQSVPYADGQQWYTNLNAVINDPLAANNPHFGIRMVNASMGADCVSGTGAAYNNSSGNWRFDNVAVIGAPTGMQLTPPVITPTNNATVDGPFTNTFADVPNWRTNISTIAINGTALTSAAYVITPGQIVFTPSASPLLQLAGPLNFVISATNYNSDPYIQIIGSGLPTHLTVFQQPVGPTGNGGTLVIQPSLEFFDQYGNIATNCSATYTATTSAGWSFGPGSGTSQSLVNGLVNFTNLSATSAAGVAGATITFTASSPVNLGNMHYTTTNTSAINIPAPASTVFTPGYLVVEQLDAYSSKNSTFSMVELNPGVYNSAPVMTLPVPATGPSALRQSSAGSTGRLADSDDGTLLCFTAGQLDDSTAVVPAGSGVPDITTVTNRGCGTFDFEGNYVLQATYQGQGGSTANQARSGVTIDDTTFYMGDKGGVYTNDETADNAYIDYSQDNPANVRSLKSYGGVIYALQQQGKSDPISTVMAIVPPPSSGLSELSPLENFPLDASVTDFAMTRSGNNGDSYDCCYYLDSTNFSTNTFGTLNKYFFTGQYDNNSGEPIWQSTGLPVTNSFGGDGLCVATNSNGTVDIYFTTGVGGTASNSVVHMVDSAAWNLPINLISTNVIYTTSSNTTLKGIAFAPLPPPGNVAIYPVFNLTNTVFAASGPGKGMTFTFTSTAAGVASSFAVWSSTNLTLPFSKWTYLGQPTDKGGGVYSFTDPLAGTKPATFYQVTSP